jgi:hypothetical protein
MMDIGMFLREVAYCSKLSTGVLNSMYLSLEFWVGAQWGAGVALMQRGVGNWMFGGLALDPSLLTSRPCTEHMYSNAE